MSFIFLDQISTTANLTKDEDENVSNDEQWRKSIVQTVTIPDLEHLEIRSKHVRSSEAVWRPDGSVSKELQEQIRHHVETFSSELVIDKEDLINEPITKEKKSTKTYVKKQNQKQKAIRNRPHGRLLSPPNQELGFPLIHYDH